MSKRRKLEKHLIAMKISILNAHSVNHKDYRKNTNYFRNQIELTKKKLKEIKE
jgi:hypothetical protein